MVINIHQMDTILHRASLLYQRKEYKEALCAYVQLQNMATVRHNQQAPCQKFREKAYLRVFKAVLYSSMGACLVSMHKNPEAYELFECSLKMCPTSLALQRLTLLLIRMNRLSDIQRVMDILLKPSIIRPDTSWEESRYSATITDCDAMALKAVLLCYAGSTTECLNTLSLSIVMLLRGLSNTKQLATGEDLPNLLAPELLQDSDKLRCRLAFLALCNILQTFSHRGVILPYRCDYNIEELISRLCDSKIKGLCLNTIFDPSFVSHEAHNAFIKYGGDGSLPGAGLQSLDSVYSFFQVLFPSSYDGSHLPVRSSPFFDDRIFSPEAWSTTASKSIVYSRLRGQATLVQHSQLLEVMDDSDLTLLIIKKYGIKPLSYSFTLPDSLLSLITEKPSIANAIKSQSVTSIDTVIFTHKDSTAIAKIMRAKENQTIRAFRLTKECTGEGPIHHPGFKEHSKKSVDPLRESLRSKVMSYLQLSSEVRNSLVADSPKRSHTTTKGTDITSKLVLQDLQVSLASLATNQLDKETLDTNNVARNMRSHSTHLSERSTVATRASTKAAERVHLVATLRPAECEPHKPSYIKFGNLVVRSASSKRIPARKQQLAHSQPRRHVLSLPSYSTLHKSEMDVPDVCLSTLKRLVLKKKKVDAIGMPESQQTLICTNLPVFQKIESVRPLAIKASTQNTPSTDPSSDFLSLGVPPIPDIEQYSESLSLHDHTSVFRKAPVAQHPMRSCVSCPVIWNRDRPRQLNHRYKEHLKQLHDAELSTEAAGSLSFRTLYYNEMVHAVNSGDRAEILLNYSMSRSATGLSSFDFVNKDHLNSYKNRSRSQSLEQSIVGQSRLLQSARNVFNAYKYIETNISITKESLNRLALAMRANNKEQCLTEGKINHDGTNTDTVAQSRQTYSKEHALKTATSPSAIGRKSVQSRSAVDKQSTLPPIALPDLKSIISTKPVRFVDYFLNQIDLELVHGDAHERRTLLLKCEENARQFSGSEMLHSKAISRKRTSPLSNNRTDCNSLHHRMNVAYVPDYQEMDQENSLISKDSILLSSYPSRRVPDLLRGVVLELTGVRDSSTTLSTRDSSSSTSLESLKTSNECSPDVKLRSHTSRKGKGNKFRLFAGSKLYKRNSYRYKAFTDVLLNNTTAQHMHRKHREISITHIHTSVPIQRNSQVKLSVAPKEPRRPKKLSISTVVHKGYQQATSIKILRLRTASFTFRTLL